ncbi:MAG: hypothetical protein WC328_03865 [Kiritimatiellia bacterium]
MTDAERRAVFDEIKERSQSEPLTGADEDFLRHFEEFLDEALGIGGKAANRWSGEARAAALEARRAKARAEGGGGLEDGRDTGMGQVHQGYGRR